MSFYNTFRNTSNSRKMNPLSKSLSSRETLVNIQKREKLKGLLITKFMKKYGIKNPEKILQDEISKFLEGEKLTDADLKRLDEKLKKLIQNGYSDDLLKKSLSDLNDPSTNYVTQGVSKNPELILPDLKKPQDICVSKSMNSKTPGGPMLSKYQQQLESNKKKMQDEYEEMLLEEEKQRKPVNRIDFSNEGDEWNAICKYNHKMFEEEKKMNKLKDFEIKRRTKDDLDNQIRQKLRRENEENLKNKEYDNILLNHCEFLNDLEHQKQQETKKKVLREKENRDKQLKDETTRKKN